MKLEGLWATQMNSYVTLGCDGLKGNIGNKVYIFTQAKGSKYVMFDDCIEEPPQRQTKEVIANMWINKMIESAGGEAKVEDMFAGIVADNTASNPAAGKILVEKFPKLFFSGCRAHAADLLMEDVAKVPEIKNIVDNVREITKFIRNHHLVKQLFNQLGGTSLQDFPDTHFAYAEKMLDTMMGKNNKNLNALGKLISHPRWGEATANIDNKDLVANFVGLLKDDAFIRQVGEIRGLTLPVSVFIHHLEQTGARTSWLRPLFTALEKEIEVV